MHLVAFLPRHRLGQGHLGQLFDQAGQDPVSDFRVRHLAPAEEHRRLDLVAFLEEPLDVLLLELVIVLVHLRPELDFLDLDDLLVLLRLARALGLLVLILPVVHDPADRRHGGRGDLHEVQTLGTRDGQRLGGWHDAQLLAGFVDHPDLTDPDALVGADAVVTTTRTITIECDTWPPGAKDSG